MANLWALEAAATRPWAVHARCVSRAPAGPALASQQQQLLCRQFEGRTNRVCNVRRQAALCSTQHVVSAAAAVPTPPLLRKLPVPQETPYQPSGQPACPAYDLPLCGRPQPLGATYDPGADAVNFAVVASGASSVALVLFRESDLAAGRPTWEVALDPELNRTGDVWHVALPRLDPALLYGYRVDGPMQEAVEQEDESATVVNAGHRYNPEAVVLDPYARAILSRRRWGQLGPDLDYSYPQVLGVAPTWPQAAAMLPTAQAPFDWEGDRPLGLPMEDLVIYEMHVRAFTRHASSRAHAPGTYAGIIERLDYLQSLGVNALELLPIHEFNELEYYQLIPGSKDKYRYNVWGYSTIGFFAPMARYSQAAADGRGCGDVVNEFKQMVKECHRRGIEVILDVVFNHTAEGNQMGPSLSFRGLDNRVYYMLAPGGEYYNYSGCGNTLNCNHPVVRQFIVDCLRYWVTEMHVDGFRFDLASILTRAHSLWHPCQPAGSESGAGAAAALHSEGGLPCEAGYLSEGGGGPTGTPLPDPPLVEAISEDPVLRGVKLIAEAWDCDGLNQVGAFPHYAGRWAEWNGHFRDTVRQFIKGTEGPWASGLASALCGSPNIYGSEQPGDDDWWGNNGGRKWRGGRGPVASVNFITAHDGFTLADLVSYNDKHNDANGEGNRDGEKHNLSWNCGAEGPSASRPVQDLRQRQMRNFMAALLLSHGVPMLQMGDEYGHTKNGNNNTYCHDDELNWFDWERVLRDNSGYARFVRHLVNFRRQRPELRRAAYVDGSQISWHGVRAGEPDWSDSSRLVAAALSGPPGAQSGGLYYAFNSGHLAQVVELPHWPGRAWQLLADTAQIAPYDWLAEDEALSAEGLAAAQLAAGRWTREGLYPLLPRSAVILLSVPAEAAQAWIAPAGVRT